MIDTVVIVLDKKDFIISKPKRFNPSAEGLILTPYYPKSNQGYFKCVNNPRKREIQQYGYLPRLTLIARNDKEKFLLQLKIEFSAPKMLYGNNFDELTGENFYELIAELKEKLKIMGVVTTEDKLIDANISAIHYSKNIVLDKYTKCSYVRSYQSYCFGSVFCKFQHSFKFFPITSGRGFNNLKCFKDLEILSKAILC